MKKSFPIPIHVMTLDEVRMWRKQLLWMHYRCDCKESKDLYGWWLIELGTELNKRCDTTRYLPR